jgi:tRNA pseudouridine38-40 synthase
MGLQVRLRLDLAYDGTDFSGWASQPGRRTVQGVLEAALERVLRLPATTLTVAGRTDAGVHARGQVCHLDIDAGVLPGARSDRPAVEVLSRQLIGVLPDDVRVRRVSLAPAGFDARFSALWRRYAYRLWDDAAQIDPLRRHEVVVWRRRLDDQAMNQAAALLVGEHDFAAYCRKREGGTTIRTLLELSCARAGDNGLEARVVADAFCHNMVRALMGALLLVGEGKRDANWPVQVLSSGDRHPAAAVVPPHGLTLEEVGYPAADQLAARARESRAIRTVS